MNLLTFIKQINELLWNGPMLFLLMGTHIYFTFYTKGIQKKLPQAIKYSVRPEESFTRHTPEKSSGFSGFGSLAATLAATLGTGNIIGMSTAIFFGGPGAIFWCWITGILGMATSYAECYLSHHFRRKKTDGSYYGGPMFVLEDGLHKKRLAILYALCILAASFGVGCTTQANSISNAFHTLWKAPTAPVGIVTAVLVGLVIIGGVHSMEKLCTRLVPAMGFLYMAGCIILLFLNHRFIPQALLLIIQSAFSKEAVVGCFFGVSARLAARYGIARGLFTNEAGLGSAGIAAASSSIKSSHTQALISMTATFWDTVVMCAITGIVIITALFANPALLSGTAELSGISPANLTLIAFEQLPVFGSLFLEISLVLFAFATLIGWSYFGEEAFRYLCGEQHIRFYQIAYLVMIFIGAISSLELVWECTDLFNVFLAIPNLIALFTLRKVLMTDK